MRLLTQNVLNYPEVLESSRRSSECLLFFVISIDNDLITEKQSGAGNGDREACFLLKFSALAEMIS